MNAHCLFSYFLHKFLSDEFFSIVCLPAIKKVMTQNNKEEKLLQVIFKLLNLITGFLLVIAMLLYIIFFGVPEVFQKKKIVQVIQLPVHPEKKETASDMWQAPDTSLIPKDESGKLIRYGRMLIANTSYFLGPKGKVHQMSNGMNCQNCHLEAGTKPFGNNYSGVASTYPKFRERSGSIESIYKRVNDCFERSLNGKSLDTLSKEMQAIKAYIVWLGKDVSKGERPKGVGLTKLTFLDRAADPEKGKLIYAEKCSSCHNLHGEGKMNADGLTYQYPPLWGPNSYNIGAGLYRLTRLAGYIKSNMPFGATYDNPQITDEEAWDIAAYVNSQPHPLKDLKKDWPNSSDKAVDEPFGPYTDTFTEKQHKYGPFEPIAAFKKKEKEKKAVKPIAKN
jgi:thiosulfate dehydrogenase